MAATQVAGNAGDQAVRARAVNHGRAKYCDCQSLVPLLLPDDSFSRDFAVAIIVPTADGGIGLVFCQWLDDSRPAVHAHSADMNQPPTTGGEHGGGDAPGGFDGVGNIIRPRRPIGNSCRGVKDHVGCADDRRVEWFARKIANVESDAGELDRPAVGIFADDGSHRPLPVQQFRSEVAAEESRGTGEEGVHGYSSCAFSSFGIFL